MSIIFCKLFWIEKNKQKAFCWLISITNNITLLYYITLFNIIWNYLRYFTNRLLEKNLEQRWCSKMFEDDLWLLAKYFVFRQLLCTWYLCLCNTWFLYISWVLSKYLSFILSLYRSTPMVCILWFVNVTQILIIRVNLHAYFLVQEHVPLDCLSPLHCSLIDNIILKHGLLCFFFKIH